MISSLSRIFAAVRASLVCILMLLAGCSGGRVSDAWQTPRLVVVVVVDQMRYDYLTRFSDQYTAGLARLVDRGVHFTEARHDHALTYTAPGHASLATGVYPSRHGIVDNFWWTPGSDRTVYAVQDTVAVLRAPDVPGSSAALLLREPLGTWLKEAQPESKVYSVSLKDRASILMGGAHADAAYWMAEGRFVTSASYAPDYPEWVRRFNGSAVIESYFPFGWTRLFDEAAYGASREDAFQAEADGVKTTFPHLFEGEKPGATYYDALSRTPFGDEVTFSFASTLVDAEGLGTDAATDLLWISASAADIIGHAYGPFSQEVQDYYLRLDRMLGTFLDHLDQSVGPEDYLLVLTSDHGVMPMPEELLRRGMGARRVNMYDLAQTAAESVRQRLGLRELPVSVADGVVIRLPRDAFPEASLAAMRRELADELLAQDMVADVFTHEALTNPLTEPRPFFEEFRRSYYPGRSADLLVRYREYYLPTESPTGTTHGSPYDYDAHVPLIFLHGALRPVRVERDVHLVDLAPTLAMLMRIDPPRDLDGRALRELRRAADRAFALP